MRAGRPRSSWKEARGAVAAFRKADEPVVVAPRWAEPLARQAFGDEAFPIAQVARADVDRFERAVEISILGERAPELAGWAEEAREEHGKLVFRRLRNPGYRAVVADFVELARPPSAEVRTTEPEEACRWNPRAQTMSGNLGGNPTFAAQRFECPSGVFFNVGATVIADEEFRPRRCLWAHPPRRGEIVTRFHGVRLGETIEGHGGIYWMIEREKKGAPVTIAVRVDGEEIGRVTHADGEGWARFDLPLGRHARAEGAEVEFGVSSADHRHRHFCFEATSR
ncbi:MAG: hypothetical protein R3F14_03690 [Polyangiaceae bacterium]